MGTIIYMADFFEYRAFDVSEEENWDVLAMELKEEGRTVLLTTHYLPEAVELCDRMVIMKKGEIVAKGTPAEIIGDAANLEEAYIALVKEE